MDSVGGAIGVAIILGLIFCADKMFSYAAFFLSLTITTISIVLPVGIILFLIPFTLVNNKKAYQGVIEITDRSIKRDRVKEIRTVSRKKLRNSIIIVCVLLIFESYQFVKTIRFREELAGKSFLNGEMTDVGRRIESGGSGELFTA